MLSESGDRGRKEIVIVCAGGQAAIVADILLRAHEAGSRAIPIGYVDDTAPAGTSILGLDVLGPLSALAGIPHDAVVVALGDNRARRELTDRLRATGEHLATAIHPFTSIAPSATIGEGSMISAGAIVTPRAVIGRGVILNTKASVDHDSVVGDFAHVSAGGTVGAGSRIGDESLIALGASVISRATVGARSIIGGGAVVVDHIPDDVVAFGVPARVRRRK